MLESSYKRQVTRIKLQESRIKKGHSATLTSCYLLIASFYYCAHHVYKLLSSCALLMALSAALVPSRLAHVYKPRVQAMLKPRLVHSNFNAIITQITGTFRTLFTLSTPPIITTTKYMNI